MGRKGNANESEDVCSGCGKRFTPIIRARGSSNLNIFGGVDTLCVACMRRNERATESLMKCASLDSKAALH